MKTIAELFSSDPRLLSDEELDTIISHMREARQEWAESEKKAAITKKPRAPRKTRPDSLGPKLTLDDLDLGF